MSLVLLLILNLPFPFSYLIAVTSLPHHFTLIFSTEVIRFIELIFTKIMPFS